LPLVAAVHGAGAAGNASPIATIAAAGRLFVTNAGSSAVTEYAPGASGNVAPIATISGPNTGLNGPAGAVLVAPAVVTGSASAITTSSATLGGSVNPNGSDAHYYFECGPTTAYGKTTPLTDAGAGGSPVAAKAKLTSLPPNSTFHYRLAASSDAGIRHAGDRSFTTT
jgi:hypothetical protein